MNLRYRGGNRAVNWLAKRDPVGALTVARYGRLPLCIEAVNDNEPDASSNKLSVELLHEVKPNEDGMVSQSYRTWATNTVPRKRQRKDSKPFIWRALEEGEQPRVHGYVTRVGNLVFNSNPLRRERSGAEGLMTEYTRDKRGNPVAPCLKAVKPRGGKQGKRSPAEIAGYLQLAGVPAEARPGANLDTTRDMLDPTPQAQEAAALLAAAYANTTSLPPVQKCPTGIAKNAGWFAGVSDGKQAHTHNPAVWQVSQDEYRAKIGDAHARILDMALSNETFSAMGIARNYSESYADIGGKAAFMDAVLALKAVMPANDNRPAVAKAA